MPINDHDLRNFIGTNNYFRHSLFRSLIFTDGIHYLMENGAAWLVDVVGSHQINPVLKRGKLADFQLWELKVNPDKTAVVTCRADSGVKPAITQRIEYTDFPMEEIKLYVERGSVDGENIHLILMLPSER